MARSRIKPEQISNTIMTGTTGTDQNPLPTSYADSPNTSVTFTVPVASFIYVHFGARMQVNTTLAADIIVNIDGSDQGTSATMTSPVSGQVFYVDVGRTNKFSLTAGSHTIKLRSKSTVSNAAVAIAPYWFGIIVPQ